MRNLTNKVVIITGGSKGIGRETAKLFAQEGARVIITGRQLEPLKKACKDMNQQGTCDYYQGDVTSIDDCKHIIDSVFDTYQHIDILINNAGMSMRGLFEETTLELFHKIMDINFSGAVNMTKFALPHLIRSQGQVLFISSLSGLKGIPGIAPYGTAKMALTGFSESLRAELYHHHVHVGIVYVGFTENDPDKTIYDAKGKLIPLKRPKNNDTQQGVAHHVLKVVKKKKAVVYLTGVGKIAQMFYRFFPRLSGFLLRKFAMNNKRFKS